MFQYIYLKQMHDKPLNEFKIRVCVSAVKLEESKIKKQNTLWIIYIPIN